MRKFSVEFEVILYGESPDVAYAHALDHLQGMVVKQKAANIARFFETVPNGGVDGAPPTFDGGVVHDSKQMGWRGHFGIVEVE